MIVHVVTFTFVPRVTDEDVRGLTADLEEMAAAIPALRSYRCGPSLRLRPDGGDYAVIASVDDAAGLDAYLDSAEHRAVYERWLGWMIESRTAVQIEADGAV